MTLIRPLDKDLQQAAIKQLNEVPERIPDDLVALKTWIKQQPHLRIRDNDQLLLAFLRGCKYSLEKTKSKLDKYYTLRSKFPDLFCVTDVDSPVFREILNLGVFTYLPKPLYGNGPRIAIMRSGLYSPEKYTIEQVMQISVALQEIAMIEDDNANVHGIMFIMDLETSTLAHMLQMSPGLMKKFSVFSEEGVPLRPKASHFINTPSSFESLFNVIKPMLSKKQQDRLFVHGSKLDSLYEKIPKEYLPKEYGGENGSLEEINIEWIKKIDDYRDYFRDNVNYGSDEKLRPGQPIDFESMFGLEGSFRKLNVD